MAMVQVWLTTSQSVWPAKPTLCLCLAGGGGDGSAKCKVKCATDEGHDSDER